MRLRIPLFIVLIALVLAVLPVQAQTATPTPPDPNGQITFPPPVYLLRGEAEVRGSAALPGMSTFFLEYQALADGTLTPNPDGDWFPATLPEQGSISDDVLGTWNTALVPDGLYALRLTMNVANEVLHHVISPLRVENDVPDFVVQPTLAATPTAFTRPTLAATPTAISATATATATVDANVRTGDSTLYDVVGFLLAGDSAEILGRSATGSGWYYIQLDNGRRGFVSPSVVNVSGSISGLPGFNPPATPTPTFTPTPDAFGDLLANGHSLVPERPTCNEPFKVQVNITNAGSRATSSAVTVLLQDYDVATNTLTTSQAVTLPIMEPGDNFVAVFDLTIGQFPGEDHRFVVTIDSGSQVNEENETNNTYSATYRLRRGAC